MKIRNFLKLINPTRAKFKIADTKLYVPVVTLSTKDDNNFLQQSKLGFKSTIIWNKYRSEMTNQTKTNHLNHSIKYSFIQVFDHSFKIFNIYKGK